MSKTYSMPGWRMGFRSATAHRRLGRVIHLDYGAFTPVQVAATAASTARTTASTMRATYRADATCGGILAAPAGKCAAARLDVRLGADPGAVQSLGSVEFSTILVEKAEVAVSPAPASASAAGHVRIACGTSSDPPGAVTSAAFLKPDGKVVQRRPLWLNGASVGSEVRITLQHAPLA
jgi:alanine-synthesizing transaminase